MCIDQVTSFQVSFLSFHIFVPEAKYVNRDHALLWYNGKLIELQKTILFLLPYSIKQCFFFIAVKGLLIPVYCVGICFAGMSGYFYQYITVVVRDFIFFHDDVQSTTIAVAIASSLCCSIVWAICHLLTLGSSSASCKSTKDKRPSNRTSNFAWSKSKRRKSPTNVRMIDWFTVV